MKAVATLEIRDAYKLSDVHALQLARELAQRKGTGIIKKGATRAVLRVARGATVDRAAIADWLEDQGVKLTVDRREYADTYKATLYQ